MRDTFEQHGSAWFAPCSDLHSGPVFHAASEPRPSGQQQQQQAAAGAAAGSAADVAASSDNEDASSSGEGTEGQQQGEQQQQEPAWQSQWAAHGWLQDNPLVRCAELKLAGAVP